MHTITEVLDYMVKEFEFHPQTEVEFQGNWYEVNGFMPDTSIGSKVFLYRGFILIVGEEEREGAFLLSFLKNGQNFDQTNGIELPIEVRDELIDYLYKKGEL